MELPVPPGPTGSRARVAPAAGGQRRALTSSGRSRIAALDVLRGFALCGVLLANVRPIANAGPVFVPHVATGPQDGYTWLHLLVDQRFLPIFSLLFGIGFSLLLRSAAERVARPRLVLVRRLLALLVIGLVHLLVLWPGDILTIYAGVGLLVLIPSTWLPRWAVAGAAAALIATSLLVAHGGNTVIPGLFLLGSTLVRYRAVDRLGQSTRVPAGLGLLFAAAAVPALAWQIGVEAGDPRGPDVSVPIAVAGLLLAGVYICTLLVGLRTRLRPALEVVFAPLGRMALTNYLTATVLVLAVGRMLGGAPETWPDATVLLIAGAVLTAQWLWSTAWLRRYRHGPLEWLWRRVTWGRAPQPPHVEASP